MMSDSIIAGVGVPPMYAGAIRIPIQGPFNTLVVVHLGGASILPGLQWNRCSTDRYSLAFPSNFIVAGFDQRSPPNFRHSTTGYLSYIGTSDDATFGYAIDEVSAFFDETGRYWVGYKSAMLNDCEISAGTVSLTSWLLVSEPPVHARSARMSWAAIADIVQLSTHPRVAIGATGLRALLGQCDCEPK